MCKCVCVAYRCGWEHVRIWSTRFFGQLIPALFETHKRKHVYKKNSFLNVACKKEGEIQERGERERGERKCAKHERTKERERGLHSIEMSNMRQRWEIEKDREREREKSGEKVEKERASTSERKAIHVCRYVCAFAFFRVFVCLHTVCICVFSSDVRVCAFFMNGWVCVLIIFAEKKNKDKGNEHSCAKAWQLAMLWPRWDGSFKYWQPFEK